jgi:hypothetical protein
MSNVADHQQLTTYNGWSNQETWLASLWLNNDESCYYVLEEALHSADSLYGQANYLEDEMRIQLSKEGGLASLWSDLLATAFERINWLEVMEHNQ